MPVGWHVLIASPAQKKLPLGRCIGETLTCCDWNPFTFIHAPEWWDLHLEMSLCQPDSHPERRLWFRDHATRMSGRGRCRGGQLWMSLLWVLWGWDFMIFWEVLARRTLNTTWLCRFKNICIWPVCWGSLFFLIWPWQVLMRFHFLDFHPVYINTFLAMVSNDSGESSFQKRAPRHASGQFC